MLEIFHHLTGQDTPHITTGQMCIRAIIVFCYAVLLYRMAPRRTFSDLSALDIVLTVVLGSSLSRALTGNAPLLPTMAAVALLVALYSGLAALAPRSRLVSRMTKGRSVPLIDDGRIDWQTARAAHLGERDILEQLRLNGLRSVDQVDAAYLERNGRISIIRKETG